ncbi:MAG: tetratricopeptide repeat protein [Porphyromonas endodontalis]|uniref:tetratricopeptide repeat protein n=1 Tax=Porphyromonas endodontalis TaxID=28124 RepID=UPI003F9EE23C
MDLITIAECALKPVEYVWRQVKKLLSSSVNKGFEEAFQLALTDWAKNTPSSSDKLRLREALEKYLQNSKSYESLDADTQAFIDRFRERLSEQPAAHNFLMMDRADEQAKIGEQNLREHGKTQELMQSLMSRMEELNMAPQYIRALLKELPLEQGLESTELALERMLSNGRIHSEGAKCLVAEFVRFLFEHTGKITEEVKRLRETGDSYLADTLDEIKRVLTGESEQSLTTIYEEFKTREQQNEVRVLKELIEAAQIQFSFGEARSFYERLIELSPTIEHHFKYALLLQSLNDFKKARRHYEEALQILRKLAKKNPEAYKPDVAKILNNLGVLLSDTNDLKKAQDYYEEALHILRELTQKNPEAYLPDVAASLNNLGVLLCDTNDLKQAQDHYEEALQIRRELAQQNPEAYLPDVAASLNNLGSLLSDTNDLKKAQDYYEEALHILRELTQKNPEAYLPDVAASLNNLGVLLCDTNDLKQAQDHYEEALQIRRELAQQNPEAYLPDVAASLNNLGSLLSDTNDLKKAQDYYEEALHILRELTQKNPEAYLPDVAASLNNLGVLLCDTNDLKQAQDHYEEALQIRRELAQQNPEAYLPKVATSLNNLTPLYLRLEKKEDAEKAYQGAHDIYQKLASRHPATYKIDHAKILAMGFYLLGKPEEDLEKAKAILGKYPEHPKARELMSFIEELAKG